MQIPGSATNKYPATNIANPNILYSSLGSFWTHIFQDKGAIKGLTLGQSEELIQRYYDFVEAVNSLSTKDIPELHIERWFPIRIKKSQVRLAPLFLYETGDTNVSYIGPQPWPGDGGAAYTINNWAHYGEVFQIGKVKRPTEQVYIVDIDPSINEVPILANRILAPSMTLVNAVDFRLVDGRLYFSKNPFDMEDMMKYQLFDSAGEPVTYSYINPHYAYTAEIEDLGDPTGTILNEEELILWVYHAKIDTDLIYSSFGHVFDFKAADPIAYKRILEKVTNLFTEGATVFNLISVICAFLGVKVVEEEGEVLIDAYTADKTNFVITDKRVYTSLTSQGFSSAVCNYDLGKFKIGSIFPKGTLLFDSVEYYDQQTCPGWWTSALAGAAGSLALPPFMFIGSYSGVLLFENRTTGDDIKLSNIVSPEKVITFPFPAGVATADAAAFNAYLNHADRVDTVAALLTAYTVEKGSVYINPLDFIFHYFLKTNTILIKLHFDYQSEATNFVRFFKIIRPCLPAHLYILFYCDVALPTETATLWENSDNVTHIGADGSNLGGLVNRKPYNNAPWELGFGFATEETDPNRTFIISHTLDFFSRTTDGDTTYYTYPRAHGFFYHPYHAAYDIVEDNVVFHDKYSDDGGDINNIPLIYPLTGTGTVLLGNEKKANNLTGDGTKFLSELKVGDLIYAAHLSKKGYRAITAIASDTSLTLESPFDVEEGETAFDPLWMAYARPSMVNTRGLCFLGD